jgi:hypothetical protein
LIKPFTFLFGGVHLGCQIFVRRHATWPCDSAVVCKSGNNHNEK